MSQPNTLKGKDMRTKLATTMQKSCFQSPVESRFDRGAPNPQLIYRSPCVFTDRQTDGPWHRYLASGTSVASVAFPSRHSAPPIHRPSRLGEVQRLCPTDSTEYAGHSACSQTTLYTPSQASFLSFVG